MITATASAHRKHAHANVSFEIFGLHRAAAAATAVAAASLVVATTYVNEFILQE